MTANSAIQENLKKPLVVIPIIGITIIGLIIVFFIYHLFKAPDITRVEIQNIIVGALEEKHELTTAKVDAKTTVKVSKDSKVTNIKVGDAHLVYEAVGTVEASLDINEINVKKFDQKNHIVYVVLPPPKISNLYLDVDKSHVVVNYRNWFGPADLSELQEKAQKEGLELIRKEVCDNDILNFASQNAKKQIEQIIIKLGYENAIVETQPPGKNACKLI